ncbi:MAG: 4-hydroxy-tetrahydrodipicolinate reductase [Oscillospiraceae bacterium]|jgi:4-hydroxy-tetrahydrodipicolinate reductase|nr:4-hydroxy-tetrahydrodipicolinate reductase [Oscillospiraceae bacterium]MCI8714948.1 4-hydroxy-tetrahydrodipicolinate reductase [Oscillospiraceae bacterium]MCI9316702.1 4-hydroxy-tetrahydrodipicolinate reductase [Oscillospiraceae bacterium]
MKILLIGHGRMGRLIEQTAIAAGDQMGGIVDIGNLGDLETIGRVADIAIDFSSPSALPAVARYVRQTGTPLLSGVTGLSGAELNTFGELGRFAPVMHSANYSLGVAVFRRALEEVREVLGDFDIEIVETHHNQKADAPSGTARLLLDAVDPRHERTPVYGRQGITGPRDKKEIGVHALRGGTEAGTHTVSFFGPDEVFEITHRASSRQIFVNGALHAARRLCRMPKGRYELKDILFGGTAK